MLTPRNGWVGLQSKNTYVCLSCQAKAQQRLLHARASADRHSIGSRSSLHTKVPHHSKDKTFTTESASKRWHYGTRLPRKIGSVRAFAEHRLNDEAPWRHRPQARAYHTSRIALQQAAVAEGDPRSPPPPDLRIQSGNVDGIRAQLRRWNDLHGHEALAPDPAFAEDVSEDLISNDLARSPAEARVTGMTREEREVEAQGFYGRESREGNDEANDRAIFLEMGDLVELPFKVSERESQLGVFVRRVGGQAQCFTITGRWFHTLESFIPYSIPGWISPKLIKPLLKHLPDAKDMEDHEAFKLQSDIGDTSVPRNVAAPVVSRLVAFHNEAQAIYRNHAQALDAAHDLLAHPSDLRYGSLTAAATALLKIPSDQLPLTALFAVRKAVSNADFGFNVDYSSHRLTGYMQIVPKEVVQLIERVRNWLRQWQDDAAIVMNMNARDLARHKPTRGAQIINQYIQKARKLIQTSRETRPLTEHGTIGPSKVRLPLTPTSDCIRVSTGNEFNSHEQDITKFIEAWCISEFFAVHPRLLGMPPLILQATGMYPDMQLRMSVGQVFLQEIGTLMPYDNRKRFDANLLLPSSQHSRPLQVLLSRLQEMKNDHNFKDSMADVRHDWKTLSVYCIDKADAEEIDDGLSVEKAQPDGSGKQAYWVHVHVANPTAFFTRDNPLSKMARHMGETVYMPEKSYSMLPKWVSRRHFSLGNDRPCLTISAKLDEEGNTLEHKITNGTVRNAIQLTPDEVNELLGMDANDKVPTYVLRVGGEPPPPRPRQARANTLSTEQVGELQLLQKLAQKRFNMRKAAGGIFFDIPRPDVNVWASMKSPGLDHHPPYRSGHRIVEGDPIIEYRTPEFRNWFDPRMGAADTVVREMMLLACETAAKWCAERHIPIIYRGTTHNPEGPTPAEFRRDVLLPAVGEDGEIPMHLGLKYMKTLGPSILSTTPVPHEIMGMQHYSKVTSPLRRYGDMILHWQIEAALRHEARTGQSLVDRPEADRAFLPFSAPALETIIQGLRPRERTVMLAKRHTERFWWLMLLMRRHHFGEDGGFPFDSLRIMVTSDPAQSAAKSFITGISTELNVYFQMTDPNSLGLGKAKEGDVWECTLGNVDVYRHTADATPVRLLERPNV